MSKKIIIFGWLNMILYANAYKLTSVHNIEKMKNLCSALQYYSYS